MILDFFSKYPFLISIISFLIGLSFMPLVIRIAKERDFVVKPNRRTTHEGEIPNIGGINIFISFLLTVFIFTYGMVDELHYIIFGVIIIILVGFVDDLIDIKAKWKLFGELTAGVFLIVFADIRLTNLHGFMGITEIPTLASYLLSFFVYIVIINSINLIDGIDGLASGLGIVYSIFFGLFFSLSSHANLALTAFAMAGSLAVFFLYNVFGKKSKIFMGDSGSLLLGFIITLFVFVFCEMNAYAQLPTYLKSNAAPAIAISVLVVPLFDTLRVMLTRIKKGHSPFQPDKNHIHHLLLKTGLKHRQVTIVLLLTTLLFVGIAIIGRNLQNGVLALIVFSLACVLTYILWRMVDRKTLKN